MLVTASALSPFFRLAEPRVTGEFTRLIKAAAEQRYALGVAYPADEVDGHGDFARPDVVEAMAWGFMRGDRQIGFFHADGTLGHAEAVESYIYRGPDWSQMDTSGQTQVIRAGDWLLGAIFDEQSWPLVKQYGMGWSMDGQGYKRTITKAQAQEKGVRI